MRLALLSLSFWFALTACGSTQFAEAPRTRQSSTPTDASTWSGTSDTDTTEPPETENDDFFSRPPAQTPDYVFVANPDRNTVTRVDVHNLSVNTQSVGVDPQLVQTTSDYQTAVVFNRGDDSVTILDVETMSQVVVPVRDNLNAMRLSPDGRYAVLWHDQQAESSDDPPAEGLESFNEASFVELATGAHTPMAVGFNPRNVVFNAPGDTAAVVSDEYLAIVHLDQAPLVPVMMLLSAEVDPPRAEEVVLTPDGRYAFVRQFGTDEILLVDMQFEQMMALPMGLNPTDLDLSPDGTQVVVLCRGSEEIYVVDAANPLDAPQVIPVPGQQGFGSLQLSSDGRVGILYTTASLVDRYAVWDRSTDALDIWGLIKPVRNVSITPDGTSMLVIHTQEDTPDMDAFSPFLGHWALTAVDLANFRSNPLRLPAEPIGFANSTEGDAGYFIMDGQNYLERIDYFTLLHEEVGLKSPPVFVGVLPDSDPNDGVASQAWVSQDHDLGRISFFDPETFSVETITGFELNSEIDN